MKQMRLFILTFAALATTVLVGAQSLQALQKSMQERLPKIDELRAEKVVGEGNDGYLVILADSVEEATRKLVAAENADRKTLYEAFAKKFDQSIEQAALVGAKNYQNKAASGTMIQTKDGSWGAKK